jgi:flagellar basal-body rod modification protein FlgD
MEITPTTPAAAKTGTAATPATAAHASESSRSSGTLAADFQTFLTLLTTQMQNQDPLNPVESTEFISQLASFSSVEQQIRSNDRLDSILEALGGGSAAGVAEWIGREVRAPGKAAFSGDAIEVGATPVDGATRAVLVVRNDFDKEVARIAVDPAAETVSWDGTDGLGTTLADGTYSFSIESFSNDALLASNAASVYATVTEVRMANGEQTLVLSGGSEVALDEVTAVR